MLERLEDWIAEAKANPSFWKKFGIILAGIVVACLMATRYLYLKDQVEKLKTEKDLADDDKKDLNYENKIKSIEQAKVQNQKDIELIQDEITKVEKGLNKAKDRAKVDNKTIDEIETWDDFDNIVK